MTDQVLPKDESFAAPDWLTPGTGTRNSPPWYFWLASWNPATGINESTYSTYPLRTGGEMHPVDGGQLYQPDSYWSGIRSPSLMTSVVGTGLFQFGLLCREEDSFNQDDLDIKITFGIQSLAGGQIGAAQQGSGGSGPLPGGHASYPKTPSGVTGNDHVAAMGSGVGGSYVAGGVANPQVRPNPAQWWAGWKGNSLVFRAGGGRPQVGLLAASRPAGAEVARVDHYAFMAYPVLNGAATDLHLEVWQVKYTTTTGTSSNVPRRLMQQIVSDGTEYIEFPQPYHLRVTVDNDATPDPEINCYIGKYRHQTTGVVQAEVQCFKDGVFANDTYTVGTDVTHTSATGNIEDRHSDKITAYTDKTIGWTMGGDRSVDVGPALGTTTDSQNFVEGVYEVLVLRKSTSAVLYRDLFERNTGNAPITYSGQSVVRPVTGRFGTTGTSLQGMFTFDISADFSWGAGPDEIRRLALWTDGQTDVSAPNDYITLDYDADDSAVTSVYNVLRQFVHAKPSTQFYNHHRTVQFKPGTEAGVIGSNNYNFGISLRGYSTGYGFDTIAYFVDWATNGNGTITSLKHTIARITGLLMTSPPVESVIASKTITSGIPNLYDGNFHTLDFRAEVYTAGTSPSSAAEYLVEFDGAPVELDDAGQYQSSTVSPYKVVEFAPTLFSGRTESFFFFSFQPEHNSGGTRLWNPPQAKAWTEGALTADPVGNLDPDTLASIAVNDEGTAVGALNTSSGALAITGSGVFDVEVTTDVEFFRPTYRIGFDSGHAYTSPAADKDRRRWRVAVMSAPLAVLQSLQTFFNDHNAMEIPFSFVVPVPSDGNDAGSTAEATETVKACFGDEFLRVTQPGPGVYDVAISIEELLV